MKRAFSFGRPLGSSGKGSQSCCSLGCVQLCCEVQGSGDSGFMTCFWRSGNMEQWHSWWHSRELILGGRISLLKPFGVVGFWSGIIFAPRRHLAMFRGTFDRQDSGGLLWRLGIDSTRRGTAPHTKNGVTMTMVHAFLGDCVGLSGPLRSSLLGNCQNQTCNCPSAGVGQHQLPPAYVCLRQASQT